MCDIRAALDDLDRDERRDIAAGAAATRDAAVADGRHRHAAVYQALAVAASESLQDEAAALRTLAQSDAAVIVGDADDWDWPE